VSAPWPKVETSDAMKAPNKNEREVMFFIRMTWNLSGKIHRGQAKAA
jgi:hypothetical protein